jgi:glycosyltransferase involved in cell wall biosynthesis
MIVKNEEDYIEQCLRSVEAIADEIIVVDTGSEDLTCQIIQEKFPQVKLYHHPWENNFSLHRNQSISYATGDWILFIDADEKIFGKPEKLKPFLDAQNKKVTAVEFVMHDMNSGKSIMQFKPLKVFRNGHIQFKNIVHNQPVTDGLKTFCPLIYFEHYGYDISEEKKVLKIQRTENLLKLRIEQNPKDYEAYFYLSQLLGWAEKWEEALECCMVYIENRKKIKPFNYAIFFSAARICIAKLPNRLQQAKKILDLAYKKDLDILLVLAEYHAIVQDYPKLKFYTHQFLEEYKKFKGEPYFIHCHTPEAYLYCATNYVMCLLREGILTLLPDFQGMTLKCIDANLKALLQQGVKQNE